MMTRLAYIFLLWLVSGLLVAVGWGRVPR